LRTVINNSGEGMNKEELKRVCKTFLKEKVAGLKSGVGIGLATAKELCQSLDGDI